MIFQVRERLTDCKMMATSDIAMGKSEVNLFDPRPIQTVLERGYYLDVHPLTNVSSNTGPIEFHIAGSAEDYIDLNDTALFVRCKIQQANTDIVAADKIFPANNFMHTMFSNISLTIGDKQVDGGLHMYPYRAYLSNLLLFGENAKKSQLRCSGYKKDQAGQMDDENNTALAARLGFFTNTGNTAEFYGPLWLDMFTQGRYLINHTDVRLRLDRSKPEFCLQRFGGANAKLGNIVIEQASLYVRRVKIDSAVLNMNEAELRHSNALYPIQRTEMLSYTISRGDLGHTKENMFRGQLPKYIVVGMVTNKAYNGDYGTNPFNFQHFNVNHVALYREGEAVPGKVFTPNFDNKLCVREYMNLFASLELYNVNEDIGISLDDFSAGYSLFGFNLTPDLHMTEHSQPYREGNLRLELKFSKALTEAINVIVMAIFDGKVEVTQHRNVITDFKT